MTSSDGNLCLAKLRDLEENSNVSNRLSVFGTSSWISIKNIIFEKSMSGIRSSLHNRRSIFSAETAKLVLLSIANYFIRVARRQPQDIFIGAGVGVFSYEGRCLDSYVPAELSSSPGIPAASTLYFLSANNVKVMWQQRSFLVRHQAVAFSFVVGPLRIFLAKIMSFIPGINPEVMGVASEISVAAGCAGISVSPKEVRLMHLRFLAGYLVYRFILSPFTIRRAYVVSAYSNSEVCAVLRKIGVEVVEVQHGLVGPTHRGYNYSGDTKRLPTPNKVSVYNDFWKFELMAAGFYKEDQVVIGGRLKYDLAERESKAFDFPYVVFSGQGVLVEEVERFVREFSTTDSGFTLLYVPHPNEGVEYLSKIQRAASCGMNAKVIDRGSVTTERLIVDSAAHISIYSSCHFDAVHYKNRTFVLDVLDDNLMYHYTKSRPDLFVLVKNVLDFVAVLKEVGDAADN